MYDILGLYLLIGLIIFLAATVLGSHEEVGLDVLTGVAALVVLAWGVVVPLVVWEACRDRKRGTRYTIIVYGD